MFSLVITIISIALVAALALASLYYGGDSFNQGTAQAEASKLLLQGQQLLGAAELYKSKTGDWPVSVDTLEAEGYLSSVPVGSLVPVAMGLAQAGGMKWFMPKARVPMFLLEGVSAKEVCSSVNDVGSLKAKVVLPFASPDHTVQCYGPVPTEFKVLVKRDTGAGSLDGLDAGDIAAAELPESPETPDPEVAGAISLAMFTPSAMAASAGYAEGTVAGSYATGWTVDFKEDGLLVVVATNTSDAPENFSVSSGTDDTSFIWNGDALVAQGYGVADANNLVQAYAGVDACWADTVLAAGASCGTLANYGQGAGRPSVTMGSATLNMTFTPDWTQMTGTQMWGSQFALALAQGSSSLAIGSPILTGDAALSNVFSATTPQFTDVSHEVYSFLAVAPGGELWGASTVAGVGALGTGSTAAVPNAIALGVSNVSKVYGKNWFSFLIKTDGTLWHTGGRTGVGYGSPTTTWNQLSVPEPLVSGSIGVDGFFGLAASGNLYYEGYTQGVSYTMATPLMSGVAKVVGDIDGTMVLTTDGRVLNFGENTFGRLGRGATGSYFDWAQVFTGAADIGFSNHAGFIVDDAGKLWVAGKGTSGASELGLGDGVDALSFTQVPGLSNVVEVAGTASYTVARTSDNLLWRTGRGSNFKYSYVMNTSEFVPVYTPSN